MSADCRRPHRPALILLLIWLVAIPGLAGAQGLSLSGGGSAGLEAVVVEPQAVLETARTSFEQGMGEDSRRILGQPEGQLARTVSDLRADFLQDFSSQARSKLQELQGDGLLDAAETTNGLDELRSGFEQEYRAALRALQQGHQPPPLARDYETSGDYSMALARYTFTERNTWLDWLLMLITVAGGALAAWLLSSILRSSAEKLQRRDFVRPSRLMASLSGPLYLTALAIGLFFGLNWVWIPGVAQEFLDRGLAVVLTISLFWFLWNATGIFSALVAKFLRRSYNVEVDHHVLTIIVRILKIAILLVAALILVKVILETGFTSMLAGLGIVGIALYLVLKGALENVAASFTIFGDKPIRVGDLMIYADQWGKVENIGFRSTRMRTLDGHLYTIPNSQLIDDTIRNVSARPWIRRRFRIGLPFDTPAEKIQEALDILRDMLDDYEGLPSKQPANVVFEDFGPYELRILIQYFFEPPDYWQAKAFDSQVNLQIFQRFAEAGIEFAFPTQTTLLATGEEPPLLRLEGQGTDRAETGEETDRDARHQAESADDLDTTESENRPGKPDSPSRF